MYLCMHACVYVCMCMNICMYVCMHVCMYECMYIYTYICMCVCMRVSSVYVRKLQKKIRCYAEVSPDTIRTHVPAMKPYVSMSISTLGEKTLMTKELTESRVPLITICRQLKNLSRKLTTGPGKGTGIIRTCVSETSSARRTKERRKCFI